MTVSKIDFIFRKKHVEDTKPWLNHYVHKDGYFKKDHPDQLSKIVRAGSSKDLGKLLLIKAYKRYRISGQTRILLRKFLSGSLFRYWYGTWIETG